MNNILFLSSVVIIVSIFMYRYLSKFGVPMLLVFISLGMIFGVNGIFKIDYENYELSRDICSFALIYIIFFGGFGTNLTMAKGIIKKSLILSSLGCYFYFIFDRDICSLYFKTRLVYFFFNRLCPRFNRCCLCVLYFKIT